MALRDDDPLGFADAMLDAHLRELESMQGHLGLVMFDRSLPDVVGFLEVSGLPVSNRIDAACHSFRYDGPIIRAPTWQAIYRQGPSVFRIGKRRWFVITQSPQPGTDTATEPSACR